MFVNSSRRPLRSGITLTEILISIMIMGVGMVSLATLFPLGLLRIREANRMTRSSLLAETAMNDLGTRNLLNKQSFLNPQTNPFTYGYTADPWLVDTPGPGAANSATLSGVTAQWGNGLPVAYDPLWRASVPNNTYSAGSPRNYGGFGWYLNYDPSEARFGSGLGFVRPDSSGQGSLPSAHGLQRLTNFNPDYTSPAAPANNNYVLYPPNTIASIFVSPEDIVFQSKIDRGSNQDQNLSTVVPDMSGGATSTTIDWRYTWMFTGHQADDKGTVFEGEIVVFENRPFAIDPVASPPYTGGSGYQVAGETVVEAVFGFGAIQNGATVGYATGADKNILLRWPNTMPDPEVKIGSWIADVTYERNPTISANRFGVNNASSIYPGQRCYWYQIVKRSSPADESAGNGLGVTGFRAMTVWISSPLRAKTQLTSSGTPTAVNAALVCPYVVNVFPRTVYTR